MGRTFQSEHTFVNKVSAYFALVADVQAVELVEPVWDRLAVPAERQVLRVVRHVVRLVLGVRVGHLAIVILLAVASGLSNSGKCSGKEGERKR